MVKISIRANFQIKTALLTATAAKPARAAAAPGLHDPSTLPVHADANLNQPVPITCDPARGPWTRWWARDSSRQGWGSQMSAPGSVKSASARTVLGRPMR